VEVTGDFSSMTNDGVLQVEHLEGMKDAEGVLRVNSNDEVTLVFNDALLNMESQGFFKDLFLAPVGKLSVPRFSRLMWLRDRRALASQLGRLSADGLRRVIVGHGATVESHAREQLTEALERLD
jgi:hypothetical protein